MLSICCCQFDPGDDSHIGVRQGWEYEEVEQIENFYEKNFFDFFAVTGSYFQRDCDCCEKAGCVNGKLKSHT